MARLRLLDPVGLYHVMTRGNFRQQIFFDDVDRNRYTALLTRVSRRRGWLVIDWCLMPNHSHLVIQLTDGGLSEGMRELNGCFSRWSNDLRGLTGTGHLVQNRFRHREVDSDAYRDNLVRYVALNPVRGGLVDRPEGWAWSGYRANAGLEYPRQFHRPTELLAYFNRSPAKARRLYRRHVESGLVSWSDHGDGDHGAELMLESPS